MVDKLIDISIITIILTEIKALLSVFVIDYVGNNDS